MEKQDRHRIGLMGGTFDPIHIGHLMLAECAYEQFQLERVLFLPSGNPPHKRMRTGASDQDRLEMVRLAIAPNPHFGLDAEEMERSGYTYTNDTLEILTAQHPDTDYYFIIGADSLMAFDTWYCPEGICAHCILAVAVRDQLDQQTIQEKMEELRQKYGAVIYLLQTPDVDISSSHLREMCRENRSIRYYVTDEVFDYIEDKQIYKEKSESQKKQQG